MLLFSDETFAELASRLMRPKFDRYVSAATRQRFLADVVAVADWVTITGTVHACRDPQDDKFLETASTCAADCLVSGDADLLVLHPFAGVPILTPQEFLAAVRGATRE